jgi:hypothetical protein
LKEEIKKKKEEIDKEKKNKDEMEEKINTYRI